MKNWFSINIGFLYFTKLSIALLWYEVGLEIIKKFIF